MAAAHAQVHMIDATRKRCDFVAEAAKELGLENTHVMWGRAEDAGKEDGHREVRFDNARTRTLGALLPC